MEQHLRQARIGLRDRQGRIGHGRRLLQDLVALGARHHAPVGPGVTRVQLADQLALGADRHRAREVAHVFVVRGPVDIPAIGPARRQRLVVDGIDEPAVGLGDAVVAQEFEVGLAAIRAARGLADIARRGAELQAAVEHQAREDRQIAVRRDVEVIRQHDLGIALRAEADRRRQPARAALARQRERHARGRQDRHVLEIDDGLAGGADVAPLVEAQGARFQVPVRVGSFAGAVGAVEHQRLVFAEEVDAVGAALRVIRLQLVLGIEQPATLGGQVQLQRIALVAVAETPHLHIAAGRDFVFDEAVAGGVGFQFRLAAGDLDVAVEIDFTVRTAVDFLRTDCNRKILFVGRRRGRRNLRMQRPRGHGDEGGQGKCPPPREW